VTTVPARLRARQLFRRAYGSAPPHAVRAPGRVNVIGEHTDYNDGFVLPAAIDREVVLAFEPAEDGFVRVASEAFGDDAAFRLGSWDERAEGWASYVQGVAWSLAARGLEIRGWRGALASDVPVGAGLSSSAALELAVAQAFHVVGGWPWDPVEMAGVCRRAENHWVGVASGIMDQLASAGGVAGHALLVDCRSLDVEPVPVPEGLRLVVLDTSTRRELGSSGYNDRRRECETAARALGVGSLRDVTTAMLDERGSTLDGLLLRRARHVVSENDRTTRAAAAMREGDPERLGALVSESHRSLRDDFAVSSGPLDAIVAIAEDVAGCYGARLTGGGFAGCALALVAGPSVASFADDVQVRFADETGLQARLHVCEAVAGAGPVDG